MSDSQASMSDHSSWAVLSRSGSNRLHHRPQTSSNIDFPELSTAGLPPCDDDAKEQQQQLEGSSEQHFGNLGIAPKDPDIAMAGHGSHSEYDDDDDQSSDGNQQQQRQQGGIQTRLRDAAYRQFDSLLRGLLNLPAIPGEAAVFREYLRDGKLRPSPGSLGSVRQWRSFGEYLRFTQDPIVTLQLQDIRISRRRMLALLDGAGPFVPVQRIIFCGNSIGLDPGCLDAVVEFVLRIPSLQAMSIHCNSLADNNAEALRQLVEKHPALISLSLVQNGLGEPAVHVLCRTLIRKASSSMESVESAGQGPAILSALNLSFNAIGKDGISQCATLRRRLLTFGYQCNVITSNQRVFPKSSLPPVYP